MPITALPALDRTSATFKTDADTFFGSQIPTFVTEANALQTDVNAKQVTASDAATNAATQVTLAATQATNAATSALAAAGSAAVAGAVAWVSGTTYAIGDARYSPINMQTYRRKVAGAGTTDPSADLTNWAPAVDASASLLRSARTSNTLLGVADKGKLIDITSGTFTQTFDAAATLRDGWFCYLKNSGTGDITLDPNASELIDGLTSYVMYPGEVRLVQCDGVALRSVVLNSFSRTFTASGTFTKPPGYGVFGGTLWGAGGSGRRGANASTRGGGGGGGCAQFVLPSASLSASTSVTIGAGGAAVLANSTNGAAGGNTTFAGIEGYGGAGGTSDGATNTNGKGGHSYSLAETSTTAYSATLGASYSRNSMYGGASGLAQGLYGGQTIYGGGGGKSSNASNVEDQGLTVFGGVGGNAAIAGSAPGGGGGYSTDGTASGAGALGELRIWGII